MARHAFIWGSNGSKAFGELRYAQEDARRMADTLRRPPYEFAIMAPTVPSDPYQVKKELDMLAKSCGEQDSFIIFFSGHGELLHGQLMLVLDQSVPGDQTTYLPVDWVKGARALCEANNRLIILDCCHAGGAVGDKAGAGVDLEGLALESKTERIPWAGTLISLPTKSSVSASKVSQSPYSMPIHTLCFIQVCKYAGAPTFDMLNAIPTRTAPTVALP